MSKKETQNQQGRPEFVLRGSRWGVNERIYARLTRIQALHLALEKCVSSQFEPIAPSLVGGCRRGSQGGQCHRKLRSLSSPHRSQAEWYVFTTHFSRGGPTRPCDCRRTTRRARSRPRPPASAARRSWPWRRRRSGRRSGATATSTLSGWPRARTRTRSARTSRASTSRACCRARSSTGSTRSRPSA